MVSCGAPTQVSSPVTSGYNIGNDGRYRVLSIFRLGNPWVMPETRTGHSPAITLDEQSIIDFAQNFDPQPYHLDRDAADASIFEGLCASGWQVGALASRLTGEALMSAGIPYVTTTQVNQLRWMRPTFVDDQLIAHIVFGDLQRGSPVPDCDSLEVSVTLKDNNDQAVAEMTCLVAVAADAKP